MMNMDEDLREIPISAAEEINQGASRRPSARWEWKISAIIALINGFGH